MALLMQLSAPSSAARRFATLTLLAALLAAVALPGARLGLGVVLVAATVLAALIFGRTLPRTRFTRLLLALAAALASMAAIRDASWLVAVDLIAAVVVVIAAATQAQTWGALTRALNTWTAKLLPAPLAVWWLSGLQPSGHTRRRVMPALRGLALGGALVLVFGVLFATADDAFAQLTGDLLTPGVDLDLLPARLGAGLAVMAITGAVLLAAAAPIPAAAAEPAAPGTSPEWVIALALLNALFAAFLAVQVNVLFGGDDHVLRTAGLTYAEYAREGFYQLLVVAFLVLGVVAVAGRRRGQRSHPRRPTAVEALLGLLCLLTLVVLASALRRLGLLEETYGFTLTRLFGHAGTLWVGAVLIAVTAAGAARRTDLLPRALMAVTALALLVFGAINPEGLVARENVERFERTGKVDIGYLRSLGADATPALANLPAAARRRARLREPAADGVFGFNLARVRARKALAEE